MTMDPILPDQTDNRHEDFARGSRFWISISFSRRTGIVTSGNGDALEATAPRKEPEAQQETPVLQEISTDCETVQNGGYPQGDSNPCFRTENPESWASRRWGPEVLFSQ